MPKKTKTFGDNPLDNITNVPKNGRSPWDAAHPPVSYRLPKEIHRQAKQVADREGVPVSQLVAYALRDWLRRYERGEASLPVKEVTLARKEVDLGM
jgi:Arc/MetJ-type ribon-helix-helix transcriptional regulator